MSYDVFGRTSDVKHTCDSPFSIFQCSSFLEFNFQSPCCAIFFPTTVFSLFPPFCSILITRGRSLVGASSLQWGTSMLLSNGAPMAKSISSKATDSTASMSTGRTEAFPSVVVSCLFINPHRRPQETDWQCSLIRIALPFFVISFQLFHVYNIWNTWVHISWMYSPSELKVNTNFCKELKAEINQA